MIELSAGSTRAQIDETRGGRTTSLLFEGVEALAGSTDPATPSGIASGSFLMAPFTGRLPPGPLHYSGQTFHLPPTLGGFAAHGLAYDQAWTRVADSRIRLSLDGAWPFGGWVEQEFTLTRDALTVSATLGNDDQVMPGAMGFHPWLRRERDGLDAITDARPSARVVLADLVPTGLTPDLGPRPWDDCFVRLSAPPALAWPNGDRLVVESTASHWVVYEQDPATVCLEPMTAPPGVLATSHPPLVEPGRPQCLAMTLRWLPADRPGQDEASTAKHADFHLAL